MWKAVRVAVYPWGVFELVVLGDTGPLDLLSKKKRKKEKGSVLLLETRTHGASLEVVP